MLEGDSPDALVASVLGGVTADYRLAAARLAEAGRETGGIVELVPPGSGAVPGGPRTRANVVLPPVPGGAGDPHVVRPDRLFAPPERQVNAPFSADEAARAVVDAAVDVLKLRGEPVSFEGLLGEILVGLDRAGHLRRLVHPPASAAADEAAPTAGPGDTGQPAEPPPDPGLARPDPGLARPVAEPDRDHVDRLLSLVRDALAAADGRRLVRLEDRWWLGERADRDGAAVPLADRVEWAVYSLLSTAGPLSEAAFMERITGLFTGPDLPDEALVRACLDSYRSLASTPDRLVTADDLARRSVEHGEQIARLVDLGHRLGFACWVGIRQQGRRVLGGRLADVSTTGSSPVRRTSAGSAPRISRRWTSSGTSAGRAAFLWEVEWTAMLGEPILRRHARIPADERLVRFLVVLPERAELVRHKLERSPLLRMDLEEGGLAHHQGQPPPRLGDARGGGAGRPRAAAGARPGHRAYGRPARPVRRLTGPSRYPRGHAAEPVAGHPARGIPAAPAWGPP